MERILLLLLCLPLGWRPACCQSAVGLPDIRSYTRADFHAAIETWDIGQEKNGILYFANNDGLLSYDGSYWKTFPLPNRAAIKSLAIDPQGSGPRILTGASTGTHCRVPLRTMGPPRVFPLITTIIDG